ncbi:MAG: hypothetical protein QOG70_3789 [Solirubrobacteraceae bacterium]|jgi:hypothetical protein|nr:hypothetical protein [Solirubrobacteraceae bacterium]
MRRWLAPRRPARPLSPSAPSYGDELGALLRLAQEGLYWQGDVEDLLLEIRRDGDLGVLARAGGPIVSRYEAMRVAARRIAHPALRPYVSALDEIFANHAMLLHTALDLLAVSWCSERLREEQDKLGPMGAQGERLAIVTARLRDLAGDSAARAG